MRTRSKQLLAALCAMAAAASAQSLDPLVADPGHYKLEFENQWVKVVRESMGPHESMPLHQHTPPGALIVFLTPRDNRLTTADGKSQTLKNRAGEIQWALPATHRSENLGGTAFEAVRVEPKALPAPAAPLPVTKLDAPLVDPKHYRVEFENEYVRVIRARFGPREKLILHQHPPTGAVVIYLTDQNMRQFSEGQVRENHYKARQVRWVGPDAAHQDENLDNTPAELIRVEVKLAR